MKKYQLGALTVSDKGLQDTKEEIVIELIDRRQPSLIVNVYNEGDVQAGIRVEFRALGVVKNPSLLNVDTQEFIKLNITLQAGDILSVSTGYGEKEVTLQRDGVTSDAFRYCTQAAIDKSNYGSDPTTSQAWYWWLRTPNSGYSCIVRNVHTSGALGGNYACIGYWGVRPLCNLKSDILVSDSTNSRGNYEFQWNAAPSTPDGISVPESCYSMQNITVTWGASTDPDGDAITYVLERSVNNGSYTKVTETAARTFTEVVSTSWNTIKYRVKARDTYGNESAYVTSSAVPVIHNQPPVISGQNADLGTKSGDFSYKYTVTDPDGDTVTVVEKVDETTLRSYTPTLGEENTMNVTGHDFTALSNGAHTITITATDTVGNKAVRTLTFTKQISGFVITLAAPLEAQAQPTRANVKVTREIPAGATFKVEATNNPFDPSPAWEDCTNAVIQGVAHVFENTINTAVKFGMNIRVTVERGDAISACWVSSIGGNFE